MITKEELKELLKGRFEECTEEEATIGDTGFLKHNYLEIDYAKGRQEDRTQSREENIYFKPIQQFPIIFEGDNHIFKLKKIEDNFYLSVDITNSEDFTEKDIKANQDALDKLKELGQ